MKDKHLRAPKQTNVQPRPAETRSADIWSVYEPPVITTYTDDEILEEMGPAQALTGILDP